MFICFSCGPHHIGSDNAEMVIAYLNALLARNIIGSAPRCTSVGALLYYIVPGHVALMVAHLSALFDRTATLRLRRGSPLAPA